MISTNAAAIMQVGPPRWRKTAAHCWRMRQGLLATLILLTSLTRSMALSQPACASLSKTRESWVSVHRTSGSKMHSGLLGHQVPHVATRGRNERYPRWGRRRKNYYPRSDCAAVFALEHSGHLRGRLLGARQRAGICYRSRHDAARCYWDWLAEHFRLALGALIPSSDHPKHCWATYMRSIRARPIGGRPGPLTLG